MQNNPELILKEGGYPVTALLEGVMIRIFDPPNGASWLCLQMHTAAHESSAVLDRMSEYLPPAKLQLAISPDHAHALGMHLMDYAKRAVEPR